MNNLDFLNNIEGAIFDLDGTVLDSAWVWEKVDIEFLGNRGFEVPEDYVEAISPLGADRAAVYTIERFGLNENPQDIVEEWFQMAKSAYANQVVCKPYAKEYIKKLHGQGIKLSVATSSDRKLFIATLEREGILKYFKHIITVDEVKRGKGYPDIYEEAARRMKLNPHRCVVFEDIITGVRGAKMGEFKVVAVQDEKSLQNREKLEKTADYYIENFQELLNLQTKI
jgi:HAD superfamily hydrolase (TIGR01509 family)